MDVNHYLSLFPVVSVKRATTGRRAVGPCAAGGATPAKSSRSNSAVTASTTGAATSSVRPASRRWRSTDVDKVSSCQPPGPQAKPFIECSASREPPLCHNPL